MDCIVHGVTKGRTRLSNFHFACHLFYRFFFTYFPTFLLNFQFIFNTIVLIFKSPKKGVLWMFFLHGLLYLFQEWNINLIYPTTILIFFSKIFFCFYALPKSFFFLFVALDPVFYGQRLVWPLRSPFICQYPKIFLLSQSLNPEKKESESVSHSVMSEAPLSMEFSN